VDNTSWTGIHVYTMEEWEWVSNLFYLFYVCDAVIVSYLTTVMMDALVDKGGLTIDDVIRKFVYFGANGVSTF